MANENILKIDCCYFQGDKPCRFHKLDCLYLECRNYTPFYTRILIIKLAAIGDVLRTTPILPILKKQYPKSHISWVVSKACADILAENKYIDEILVLGLATVLKLEVETFDIMINLDKDTSALALATLVKAKKKLGFALSEMGKPYALNADAGFAFRLSFSDRLKFKENKKTYQEIIFETLGFKEKYGEYILALPKKYINYAKNKLTNLGAKPGALKIGLNTGAGKVFPTKKWPKDYFIKLAQLIHKHIKAEIVLLGGPEELECNNHIKNALDFKIIDAGCNNTINEFMGILSQCDVIVSSDTLAMHLAIGLKIPAVALFGPTCSQEIDLYGRGVKITAANKCAPCYKSACKTLSCMKGITSEAVFKAIGKIRPLSKRL